MSRMLLIEKGRFVVLRNEDDEEVGFSSFEEFLRYCPVAEFGFNPAGKTYLDYEPSRKIHIDETAGIRIGGEEIEEVAVYENLIDHVEEIRTRQADPLWGKSLTEAKPIQKEVIRQKADADLLKQFSLTELLAVGTGTAPGTTELRRAVEVIYTKMQTSLSAVDQATTIEELKTANYLVVSGEK